MTTTRTLMMRVFGTTRNVIFVLWASSPTSCSVDTLPSRLPGGGQAQLRLGPGRGLQLVPGHPLLQHPGEPRHLPRGAVGRDLLRGQGPHQEAAGEGQQPPADGRGGVESPLDHQRRLHPRPPHAQGAQQAPGESQESRGVR